MKARPQAPPRTSRLPGLLRALRALSLALICAAHAGPAWAQAGLCALDDPEDPAQQLLWEDVTETIRPEQTLMITDLSVINDSARTFDSCRTSSPGAPGGKWTFGNVMRKLAGSQNVSDFTLNWLNTWKGGSTGCTTINGFTVGARPGITDVISTWPKLADGKLDVDKAPFRLLAIVNRIDLAVASTPYSSGTSGEGRLVFAWYDPTKCSTTKQFTVIFEFNLPKSFSSNTTNNTLMWADQWMDLASLSIGGADYNPHLQSLTDLFITSSNLAQVRTNEISLKSTAGGSTSTSGFTCSTVSNPGSWELREFKLSGGALVVAPTALTPHISKNNTSELANWINTNQEDILEGTASISSSWRGGAIGPANDPNQAWAALSPVPITSPEARHQFALTTCNGCHSVETATCFVHVMPRTATGVTRLSPFLTGGFSDTFDLHSLEDPVAGAAMPLTFNELDCRALDLYDLVNGTTNGQRTAAPGGSSTTVVREEAFERRIPRNRVH